MKTVGEILKEKREEKKLSIKSVSRSTNISQRFLEAIEKDDYSVIPGETYTIGFIRNYAIFLGLNSNELVKKYRDLIIFEQDVPFELLTKNDSIKKIKSFILIFFIVILGSGIIYVVFFENPIRNWFTNNIIIIFQNENNSDEKTTNDGNFSNNNKNNSDNHLNDLLEETNDTNVNETEDTNITNNTTTIDLSEIKNDAMGNIPKTNISLELELLKPHKNYLITYSIDDSKEDFQKILEPNEDFQIIADKKIILKVTDINSIILKVKNNENEKIINGSKYFSNMSGQIGYFEIIYDKASSNLIINDLGLNVEQIIIPSKSNQ